MRPNDSSLPERRRVRDCISLNGAKLDTMSTQGQPKRRAKAGRPPLPYATRKIAFNAPVELADRALAPYDNYEVDTITECMNRLLAIGLAHEHEHAGEDARQIALPLTAATSK